MSAASESIVLSTSHNATTSTGATWIRRNKSILPYQPLPISATRLTGPFAISAAVVAIEE